MAVTAAAGIALYAPDAFAQTAGLGASQFLTVGMEWGGAVFTILVTLASVALIITAYYLWGNSPVWAVIAAFGSFLLPMFLVVSAFTRDQAWTSLSAVPGGSLGGF